MADKRISELPLGTQAELDEAGWLPADVGVPAPGSGASKRFNQTQLSESLLARGPLADCLAYMREEREAADAQARSQADAALQTDTGAETARAQSKEADL